MSLKIQKNVSLKNFNTFGFSIKTRAFCIFDKIDNLNTLIYEIKKYSNYLFLGQGSNIVFLNNYSGLVIHINTKGIYFKINENNIIIKVAAGEIWNDFVQYTLKKSWYGLENLISIPGTVGACPVQNIGAYGSEVKDYINKVYCVDVKSGDKIILNKEECKFSYRDSIFKTQIGKSLLILEVEFKLNKKFNPNLSYLGIKEEYFKAFNTHKPNAVLLAKLIADIRLKKLPDYKSKGNVGSFFKNPIIKQKDLNILKEKYPDLVYHNISNNMVKVSAAWIIDKLNLKSYYQGDIKIHDKQALVIINEGEGRPDNLIKLKDHIQNEVYKNFDLKLEVEPVLVR